MKTAEEYLEKWSGYNTFPSKELSAIIKQAQKEAIEETVSRCAQESKIDYVTTGNGRISPSKAKKIEAELKKELKL